VKKIPADFQILSSVRSRSFVDRDASMPDAEYIENKISEGVHNDNDSNATESVESLVLKPTNK